MQYILHSQWKKFDPLEQKYATACSGVSANDFKPKYKNIRSVSYAPIIKQDHSTPITIPKNSQLD